jgi:hypothetical protein
MLPPIVGSAARTKRPSLDRISRVCKEALLAEAKAVTRCRRAAWAPSRAGPPARQWRLAGIGNPNAFSGEIRRACGIRERAEVAKRVRGWEGISVVMREGSRTFPGGPEGQVMAAGSGRGAGRGSSLGAGRTGAGWSYALRRRGTWPSDDLVPSLCPPDIREHGSSSSGEPTPLTSNDIPLPTCVDTTA